ncbi:hypothetical protein SAMN06297129_0363 [Pseudooceanicola antarcticus]|uniref:Uncharacterized protein n=2 Tax=Pseudooceanicola antarcticus TaxID=1247613 RepID=A0A285HPY6_9RHOB|nr:hypothetical protein CVM39_13970 [Pseudooceanicola antarcticus]SNY37820.1 hypothetical protein SAMN06297129_0363 [Pseudooceanicola antarcticus]
MHMAHSTGWNAGGTGPRQETGAEGPPRGRERAGLMADLTPEGDQPLGMGLMAVALMAGIVGLSSGWFGAPPAGGTGLVRASQSLLLEPGTPRPAWPEGDRLADRAPGPVPAEFLHLSAILQATPPSRAPELRRPSRP